jgi:hypothetical protein
MEMVDPTIHFSRFMDRQQRAEQFTEDIRKVIHGSTPTTHTAASSRTRSPGLAAGAALALGGGYGPTPAEATADARAACRQAAERARRSECPFDDHRAFGASVADREPRPRHTPPRPPEAAAAHHAALQLRKQNREMQQKIGAGSPWDAPESGPMKSSTGLTSQALGAGAAEAYGEALAEAQRYRKRMQGSQDLIAGNYSVGNTSMDSYRKNRSLPPSSRPDLLPQAQMKLQYDGGSIKQLSHHRAEYLNAKVLAESNRDRNEVPSVQLH